MQAVLSGKQSSFTFYAYEIWRNLSNNQQFQQ